MSGLLGFFKKFMPSGSDEAGDDESTSTLDYHKSLANDVASTSNSAAAAAAAAAAADDDDDESVDVEDDELPDYTEDVIDFKEWQNQRNQTLERYFSVRLLAVDQDYDSVSAEEEGGDDNQSQQEAAASQEDDEHEEPQTQQLETQQLAPPADPVASSSTTQRQRRKVVPHVNETIHEITWLDDMDLYTKTAHARLCRVTKVWNHRLTKRQSKLHAYHPRYQPILVWNASTYMQRIPLIPIEEDGPLCTIYKNVLNIELQQLEADPFPNLSVRDVAAAAMAASGTDPISLSRRKMRVFFYNQYANAMQHLLETYDPKQHMLLLSLHNVPAMCMMPYPAHHWFDKQAVSEHCICIGDDSIMRIMESDSDDKSYDDDQPLRTRFDSQDLEIQVAIGDVENIEVNPTRFRQFIIGKSSDGAVDVTEVSTRTLPLLYRQWQQLTEPRDRTSIIDQEPEVPPQQRAAINRGQQQERQLNGENSGTDIRRSRVRLAPQQPAGLRHAKRAKSETKYTKMNQLGDALDTHYGLVSKENYYGSQGRKARFQNCEVNVYGVVLGFGTPKITTRGDFMISVSLVDDTLGLSDQNDSDGEQASVLVKPVTLVVFCRRKEQLPKLRKAGDVLRLHRVIVQEYDNNLQLRGGASTSYVVYYGSSDHAAKFQDLCNSPQNYSLTEADEKRFYDLWKCGQKHFALHPTMLESERRVVSNIKQQDEQSAVESSTLDNNAEEPSGDYTVMVTDIIPLPLEQQRSGSTPMGFLRVWDGTGVSKSDRVPIHRVPHGGQRVQRGDPSDEALIRISKIFPILRKTRGCRDVQPPKSLCGRVVNAVVWEQAVWDIVTEMLEIGTFIRLRNVQEAYVREIGLRCMQVHSRSWLTPLPDATFEVFDLLLDHNLRIESNEPINPQSGVLPIDEESHLSFGGSDESDDTLSPNRGMSVPDSALAELLSQPSLPSSVAVVARISQTIPMVSSSNDVSKLCVLARDGTTRSFRFAARFYDAGGLWLDAIISDFAGESIFDMTASEAHRRSEVAFGFLERAIEEQCKWKIVIKTVHRNGAKFFVVESIEPLRSSRSTTTG